MNPTRSPVVDEIPKNNPSLFAEEGVPAKKQKISMGGTTLFDVQLKVLQFENQTLKELVKEFEKEKQHQIKSNELTKQKFSQLESTNADLTSKNEQYKTEIKTLEDKNDENEAQIKELNDLNMSIKNIKAEIKDSVENERETARTANEKLTKEIKELKKRVNDLEQINQKLLDSHIAEMQNLRQQKEAAEKIKLNNEQKLKAEIDDLKKKLANTSKIQAKIAEIPVVVEPFNVAKVEGTKEGWNLYYADNPLEERFLWRHDDLNYTTFRLNICDQLKACIRKSNVSTIIDRINSCDIKMLHLAGQNISFDDFLKLVSSKKVEICILQNVFFNGAEQCFVDKVMSSLPNIKEFKYRFPAKEDQSETAKNLSNLPSLNNLQKFELSTLSRFFEFEDMEGFLKKNKHDAKYVFTFCRLSPLNKIKKTENKWLKSLPLHRNISVVFK